MAQRQLYGNSLAFFWQLFGNFLAIKKAGSLRGRCGGPALEGLDKAETNLPGDAVFVVLGLLFRQRLALYGTTLSILKLALTPGALIAWILGDFLGLIRLVGFGIFAARLLDFSLRMACALASGRALALSGCGVFLILRLNGARILSLCFGLHWKFPPGGFLDLPFDLQKGGPACAATRLNFKLQP